MLYVVADLEGDLGVLDWVELAEMEIAAHYQFLAVDYLELERPALQVLWVLDPRE